MFVLLVQPPSRNATDGCAPWPEPPAPPWDLVCLHAYLRKRTGHQVGWFDARLTPDWKSALEHQLPGNTQQTAIVVRARLDEGSEAAELLREAAAMAPESLRVLCGPLATRLAAGGSSRPDAEALLAGDPEPTLRQLLEHRHAPGRLRQVPGLALRQQESSPFWWSDLEALPTPDWDSLPWLDYTRPAGGGIRAPVRISRGFSGEPADRPMCDAQEPLRLWDLDRLAADFGKCAHRGVIENVMVDPPGLWTVDRLQSWCGALIRVRNTHPWSLRMLPRNLGAREIDDLREAGCRRLELIVPSTRPEELEQLGIRGDRQALATTLAGMVAGGLEILLRAWVGGPEKGRQERRRWRAWTRALDYPPVRFQPFPEATNPAVVDNARSLNEWLQSGWWPRWQRTWSRWPAIRTVEDLEQRFRSRGLT